MNQATHWKLETDAEGVAFLTLDKAGSSANTLSSEVLHELDARLAEIEAARPRAVVVASAKPSGFAAGADIKEFTALRTPEQAYTLIRAGQVVLDRLAALPCPTVAAINGFALGGGLEVALACRYRVASDSNKVSLGLPEVQLGIHPGFGGTVRSVQLVGVRAAMQLMLTGKAVKGSRAVQLGLVDRIAPAAELLAAGQASCARAAAAAPCRPVRLLPRLGIRSAHGGPEPAQAGCRPCAARTLPSALRHHRSVGKVRRARPRGLRSRGTLHRRADVLADRTQPGARVPVAGPAQEPRGQSRAGVQARPRGRRGRHGRRHRRVVRAARTERDAPGPRREVREAGTRARERILREAPARSGSGARGAGRGC